MYKKIMLSLAAVFLISMAVTLVSAKPAGLPRGTAVIYVPNQEKYYDTIVPISQAKGLPWNGHNTGSFQQLYPGDPSTTNYGPGDSGYRGGRWWIDSNLNGYQDADDTYFLCPLLGPGRDSL